METQAKVLTTRGRQHVKETNFAVPPGHPKNKDDKGHYPCHDKSHAENAVARVMQQSKKPAWWSGTLEELRATVKRKAHSKHPVEEKVASKTMFLELAELSKGLDRHNLSELSAEVIGIMQKLAGMDDKPRYEPGQSIPEHLEAVDEWAKQGDWKPGTGEEPMTMRDGKRYIYVWQPRTGAKGYLDLADDIVVDLEEMQRRGAIR